MKNDITFVRMRNGDHLGDAKMSKMGTSLRRNWTFLSIAIDRNGFAEWKKKGWSTNIASEFLIFAEGLSYGLSKFSDDFTPFFRLWKTIPKSLGKN